MSPHPRRHCRDEGGGVTPHMKEKAVNQIAAVEAEGAAPQLPADPMVGMIERVALSPDADLDKLERMLAMKERLDAQAARVAFSRALSVARGCIPPIIKDATVDFTSEKGRTNYRHETLAGIAKAIDPILAANGLSYRFRTGQAGNDVKVTCIIEHAAGHYEETSLFGPPDISGKKNGYQALGSAVTYLQRYTLKAALGLSAEVDDDAQGAPPRQGHQSRRPPPSNEASEAVDHARTALNTADTLEGLRAVWSDLPGHVQRIPALIKLKDERKAAIEAERNVDLQDQIPY